MLAPSSLAAIGGTPLVELPRLRPAGGARILLKWEGANPTGSMKDRMALAMVEGAERDGRLKPGQRVVEFTGGSTGSSLAFVCAVKGHPLSLVTADCFSEEKIRTMRALGADVEVLTTPDRRSSPDLIGRFTQRVQEIRDRTGAYWIEQVRNEHQKDGYAIMGQEILRDCPEVDEFVQVVGTGGCSMGVGRVLKQKDQAKRVSLVEPAESPYLSRRAGGRHGVEGISLMLRPPLLEPALYDRVLTVPEEEARATARMVAKREGLLVGTSSGMNIAAAQAVAKELGPAGTVVTVAIDTGLKYLGGDLFPLATRASDAP